MPVTEPKGRPHRNHGLLSDHYLNVTLPGRPDWAALAGEAEEVMAEVSRVLDAYAPSQNEAQTEEDLVRPVLRLLGHEGTYEVQPALDTPEGTKRPDYVFYRDAASRDANKDRRLTDDLLAGTSFAVGDAKFWERAKIRANGVPLAEYAGVKPLYGIKNGLNEAFLIDTATKDRLVREDPRSAEIIKPYLRGQDIKRWSPEWRGLWMIFARRGIDIDAYPAVKHHLQQFRDRLEPRPRDWSGGRWPGRKAGSYKWFEIQDSVDYWELFDGSKIVYQVIQFHPQYARDESGLLGNDKTFFIPSGDAWLLAVLNSPLMWWHNWRYLGHMKDEALNPAGWLMEKLPIAPPTDEMRRESGECVERLISLTTTERDARRDTLDWLRVEFGVGKPGQKLEDFAALDADAFVEEVRKRRPKGEGRLTPGSLRDLRSGYEEGAAPIREARAEAAMLESRLSGLVNEAYRLTPEEIDLLWSTAPPRMPRF